MTLTTEKHFKIWDDKKGTRIEVGPDRDGLDLVEIRSFDSDGKNETSLILTPEEATALAAVLENFKLV